MPQPPLFRGSPIRIAALSAVALTLGCAAQPEPRTASPLAAVAFDGRWSGSFDAAPGFADDGLSCTDARAEFETEGGALSGSVATRFGATAATGTLGSGGAVEGSFAAPGAAVAGRFSGRVSEANLMHGQFADSHGCTGSFTLRRL